MWVDWLWPNDNDDGRMKRIDKKNLQRTNVVRSSFSPVANCLHFQITLELESKMCLPVFVCVLVCVRDTNDRQRGHDVWARYFLCKSTSIKICRFRAKKLCLHAFAQSLCRVYYYNKIRHAHKRIRSHYIVCIKYQTQGLINVCCSLFWFCVFRFVCVLCIRFGRHSTFQSGSRPGDARN